MSYRHIFWIWIVWSICSCILFITVNFSFFHIILICAILIQNLICNFDQEDMWHGSRINLFHCFDQTYFWKFLWWPRNIFVLFCFGNLAQVYQFKHSTICPWFGWVFFSSFFVCLFFVVVLFHCFCLFSFVFCFCLFLICFLFCLLCFLFLFVCFCFFVLFCFFLFF